MSTPGSGHAFGSALTGGIQDISALLPLLGTEQCEEHIASALTDGYLYAAATPLSIFGSLGTARAGFKTLLSAISIPRLRFSGAKVLADVGFKPQGVNLSLIMLDEDRQSHCAEKRLASMMTELHLEGSSHKIKVSSKCRTWNIQMIIATAVSCIISITPYIHLNLHANTLNHFVRWAFPVIRALGGFLTTTMIQLVIQDRVLSIMRKRLILDSLGEGGLEGLGIVESGEESSLDQRCSLLERHVRQEVIPLTDSQGPQVSLSSSWTRARTDVESKGESNAEASQNKNESSMDRKGWERLENLRVRIIEANGSVILRGTFLLFLFIGIIATVVGYIGCFTAVQGSVSSKGPVIWLSLEAGLTIIRIILWGLNPKYDDAPPLELTIDLDEYAPLPTCTRPAEEIDETKILPLVRAPEFLKAITSYAGLLMQFSYPNISLYYTLTRKNSNHATLSSRVLYITIYDHTERTTRIYSEDSGCDDVSHARTDNGTQEGNNASSERACFYSADELTVNLTYGILTTTIGPHIDRREDPITGNDKLCTALSKHYRSILHQVNSRIDKHDTVKNQWTLKLGEKKSDMQGIGERMHSGDGDTSVEKAAENAQNERERDHLYLEQRRVEQKVRRLIRDRGIHIENYMKWLHATTDNDLCMMNLKMRRNEVEAGASDDSVNHKVEQILIKERREMELMLVDEVHAWEEQLREFRRDIVTKLSSDGVDANSDMHKKLTRRWRTDLWKRMEEGKLAMEARMNAARSNVLERGIPEHRMNVFWNGDNHNVVRAWKPLFNDLCEGAANPSPFHHDRPSSSERLNKALVDLYLQEGKDEEARIRSQGRQKKMEIRLRREVQDVEARLEHGLEQWQEFQSNPELIELTHSHSKWLSVHSFDKYVIKALKRNELKHVIHLSIHVERNIPNTDIALFFDCFNNTSCTSIHLWLGIRMPRSIGNNFLSITGPLDTLISDGARKDHSLQPLEAYTNAALEQNRSRLQIEENRKTTVEFANFYSVNAEQGAHCTPPLTMRPSFTLRFFGPESTDHLDLQVIHRCAASNACLIVELEESSFTHNIKPSHEFGLESIKIDNASKHSSSGLTFKPGHRNTLTFIAPSTSHGGSDGYYLLDVELLDKCGNHYNGEVIQRANPFPVPSSLK